MEKSEAEGRGTEIRREERNCEVAKGRVVPSERMDRMTDS